MYLLLQEEMKNKSVLIVIILCYVIVWLVKVAFLPYIAPLWIVLWAVIFIQNSELTNTMIFAYTICSIFEDLLNNYKIGIHMFLLLYVLGYYFISNIVKISSAVKLFLGSVCVSVFYMLSINIIYLLFFSVDFNIGFVYKGLYSVPLIIVLYYIISSKFESQKNVVRV